MPVRVAERHQAGLWGLALVALAAPARAVEVGVGDAARPALRRVAAPEAGTPGSLAVAADISGGVTEALTDADSAHGRAAAGFAATVEAARWLDFGLGLSGRYDVHPRDAYGKDDGLLFQPKLSTRLAWQSGALGYGFEATAWLPGGADVGESLSGLSADGRALLSHQGSRLLVAGYAGYRLDRSAKAAGDVERLRFGDRSALGLSDYDSLLGGIGLGYAAGTTLLFGEVSAQVLLGSPKLAASPLWLSAGARHPFGPEGLSGEISLDALASARPELANVTALFPIEPRVTLNLGLRYRFGEHRAAVSHTWAPAPRAKPVSTERLAVLPDPTTVELELLDERGQPLPRAQATVTQGETVTPLVETTPGHYRLADALPGRAKLHVKAEGFQPIERDIDVSSGKIAKIDVKVEQALPAGQVRGLVRSFRGKPLAASIRLEPSAATTQTDAEGFFQIDVPPGEYEVVIEAPGYQAQRRHAKVDQQGVVIVNADLSQ
jgi:hypothetical protein